jgi:hypothetical protein
MVGELHNSHSRVQVNIRTFSERRRENISFLFLKFLWSGSADQSVRHWRGTRTAYKTSFGESHGTRNTEDLGLHRRIIFTIGIKETEYEGLTVFNSIQ